MLVLDAQRACLDRGRRLEHGAPVSAEHARDQLAHLGLILGAYKIVYDLAAAGAPVFTAWLYDLYGGYDAPQRWLSGFAWLGLLLVVAALPRQVTPRTGTADHRSPDP